ncbi:cell division protein FtsZ [Patescibacteria group bacterium]|nr:cell division protein FtsZ [Patescibacteria group bacterium]MBU1721888.1 cell division protein FtsZ [Patescibacteria group bacterium]MBU1900880.1 cell division protein FtsZ [Patescibacteria group bacterium]
MPQVKPEVETFAKIKVVGVGGSGNSAVDRMVKTGIRGVEFVVMNTDVQALHHNSAATKLHIGKTVTRGLGAGMDPEMGKRSAEESQNEIRELLKDTDMVFVTCGLGGGTGSGASPTIAQIAREVGALTVAVVTKPFTFEGPQRTKIANQAYEDLVRNVDTIITIPNDRILQIIDKKTSMLDAFKIADDVLRQGVQGISELITVPGLINVDFADVKTIMKDKGSSLMGIGVGSGESRAADAAKAAISSPLLEMSIEGARGILFTITGGKSLGMQEVSEAAQIVTSSASDDVKVIFGTVIDESLGEDVRITVIATGFDRGGNSISSSIIPAEKDLSEKEIHSVFTKRVSKPYRSPFAQKPVEPESPKREESEYMFSEPTTTQERRFTTKQVVDTEEDVHQKPVINSSTMSTQSMQQSLAQKKNKSDDDPADDLEIPAFIRKKMGM